MLCARYLGRILHMGVSCQMRIRLLLFAMAWPTLIFGQSWAPFYPGSSLVPRDTDTATFHLRSLDSPRKILSFYEQQLKFIGFKVSKGEGTEGGWVKAEDAVTKKRSSLSVFVAASSEGTEILITLCCAPDEPTEDQVVNLLGKPNEEYACENVSTISSAFAGVVAPLCGLVRIFQGENQRIAKVARQDILDVGFRPFWSDSPALYLSYAKRGRELVFLGSSVGTLKELSAEVTKAVAETATSVPTVAAAAPSVVQQQAQYPAPQQQVQQQPESKHPKLERALGMILDVTAQVSLTTECPKIYRKPVVFMTANDVQWLQACNSNGYMLFGIYMYTGPR
jgi:hypothetical protein